ncbi:hypothetical protein ACI2IX_19865 [Leifsonia aquatica]|uniref:hypothetical protein n=1 Tax=Leifsonia aquatica TaxID=144185 RepID=UPI00384AFE05
MRTIAPTVTSPATLAGSPIRSTELRVSAVSPVTATPAGFAASAALVAAFVGGFGVGQAIGHG